MNQVSPYTIAGYCAALFITPAFTWWLARLTERIVRRDAENAAAGIATGQWRGARLAVIPAPQRAHRDVAATSDQRC